MRIPAKPNVAAAWLTFVVLLVAFLVVVPTLHRLVARQAWNGKFDLLPVVVVLSLLKVGIHLGARPQSHAGRISFFVSSLPLAGLLLAAVTELCCPGGHPPVSGLLWWMTGSATPIVLVAGLVLLARAVHRGERMRFVGAEMAYLTACVPVAVALLPPLSGFR